ncbi:MAG TPA: class I SAM-dependent methyltransferase [Kofleriaceae bacterium]|nr:class I SAM-dependent methyltransferase [Kofleriaceae bacterium]
MTDDRQRWNARYRAGSHQGSAPAAFVVEAAEQRPAPGRVLDVAGGAGRNAVFLAERGFEVTLVDVADAAIERAGERAATAGVSLDLLRRDLEAEPLPSGPWDVILCFHYLHRPLFAAFARELAPGGQLWLCQPTAVNLERHERPSRRFVLEAGEARRLAEEAGLEVVRLDQDWSTEGRHEARLVALKPG